MSGTRGRVGGALENLASHAVQVPEDPWLFHRPGWSWRWRSYAQVADQVARGAAGLRSDGGSPHSLAFQARQHPDALAVALAVQAGGHLPVASVLQVDEVPAEIETWVEVEGAATERGRQSHLLPPCHGGLERWVPQPLALEAASGALATIHQNRLRRHTQDELTDAAQRLQTLSQDFELGEKGGRPILSTGPALDPFHTHAVLTWSLWNDAAWVLEPQPDAFVAAVRWARPTVVVATEKEAQQLALELGASRGRKHWRLRVIVVVGVEESTIALRHWQALGVEVRRLVFGGDMVSGAAG